MGGPTTDNNTTNNRQRKDTTQQERQTQSMNMKLTKYGLTVLAVAAATMVAVAPAHAADKKPNILFIMDDDIGS